MVHQIRQSSYCDQTTKSQLSEAKYKYTTETEIKFKTLKADKRKIYLVCVLDTFGLMKSSRNTFKAQRQVWLYFSVCREPMQWWPGYQTINKNKALEENFWVLSFSPSPDIQHNLNQKTYPHKLLQLIKTDSRKEGWWGLG